VKGGEWEALSLQGGWNQDWVVDIVTLGEITGTVMISALNLQTSDLILELEHSSSNFLLF